MEDVIKDNVNIGVLERFKAFCYAWGCVIAFALSICSLSRLDGRSVVGRETEAEMQSLILFLKLLIKLLPG